LKWKIECAQIAYDEERERLEEEWKKDRQRVKERLLRRVEEGRGETKKSERREFS
jgi:hypothetical protein